MRPIVRMIAQAHLDPVWLWRWTEGRAEALATSRSAVDRLREYPSFHYTRGEAQVYEWIEEEAPELFAEIKELINAGRWHVVNGMIIQPDMNLPQGESFVRQALLGKRYLQEKFGVDVRVAYCVDSFGHAGTLPQILSKCGFDYYVFMRPQDHEKALPRQPFWWQGPDGSRVLAYRISGAYTFWPPDVEPHVERALADRPPQVEDTMCFFGVGNHGGGPTKAQIENVLELAQRRSDVEIRFDHPAAYFARVAPLGDQLPVVADELQYHATGCYSVNSQLKRMHRQAECALLWAERMAALAEIWADKAPDRAQLRALWHDLLFNQFHDTLAGSSIKEAEDEAIMCFGRVIMGARELADTAGRQIGQRVDTQGPGSTVLLFNPFPYRRTEYVEYEPWTENQRWQRFGWGLVDETGRPVPCQVLEAQAAVGNAERGIERLLFRADLPPLGYRLYRFGRGLESAPVPSQVRADAGGLENDLLAVRVDPATGCIVSCIDKASGVELVGPGGWNVAQVLEDTSDTWSHGVRAFDKVVGEFRPHACRGGSGTVAAVHEGGACITIGDQGPLQASLFIERSYEGSNWLQQLILRAGEREILVRNWLSWQGHWRMVKLAFDVAVAEPQGYRDVPFGAFPCSGDGAEIPVQMWMDVSGRLPSPLEVQRRTAWLAQAVGFLHRGIAPTPNPAPTAVEAGKGANGGVSGRLRRLLTPPKRRHPFPAAAGKGSGDGAPQENQGRAQEFRDLPTPEPLKGEGREVRGGLYEGVVPSPRSSPSEGEEARGGLALLNDGKYAGDVNGSTLRLTILRCPPYAYHIPHVMGTKQRYDWVDQGPQEFTLILRPHLGDWRTAGVVRRARELNLPIQPVTMYAHPGDLPPVAGLLEVEGDELELTALKPAEDGRGYILRLADRHGHGGATRLTWLGQTYNITWKSHEVVTLRLERRGEGWAMSPCDMIERPSE